MALALRQFNPIHKKGTIKFFLMYSLNAQPISGQHFPFIPPDHTKGFLMTSSQRQMFFKIGVLKVFAIFTGKRLCWNLFLINLHRCFPVNIVKILKIPFPQNTSGCCFSLMFLWGIRKGDIGVIFVEYTFRF